MNAESCQNGAMGGIESVDVIQRAEPVFANIYGAQESIQPGWELIHKFLKTSTNTGCIQRETRGMRPYAGADYNLTLSHSRLRSPAFLPKRRRLPTNVSPIIRKWNNQ